MATSKRTRKAPVPVSMRPAPVSPLSKERIRQIEQTALRKLRMELIKRGLDKSDLID